MIVSPSAGSRACVARVASPEAVAARMGFAFGSSSRSGSLFLGNDPAARDHRDPFGDRDAFALDLLDLVRVVGQQPNAVLRDAEVAKDGAGDPVGSHIGAVPEHQIRRDGVVTEVLQVVCTHLLEQSDAATFLSQVDDDATTGEGNEPERLVELLAAVAALTADRLAGETFGMDSDQRWIGRVLRRSSVTAVGRVAMRMRWSRLQGVRIRRRGDLGRRGQAPDVGTADDTLLVGFAFVPPSVETP